MMLGKVASVFGISAVSPLLIGAVGTVPPGFEWIHIVTTIVSGPIAVAFALVCKIIAGRRRARAKLLEAEAAKLLADKDPSNDEKAIELKTQAEAARSDADVLDKKAG